VLATISGLSAYCASSGHSIRVQSHIPRIKRRSHWQWRSPLYAAPCMRISPSSHHKQLTSRRSTPCISYLRVLRRSTRTSCFYVFPCASHIHVSRAGRPVLLMLTSLARAPHVHVSSAGRAGNSWESPPGCLMFSFTLLHGDGRTLPHLQYVASLAVAQGVQRLADKHYEVTVLPHLVCPLSRYVLGSGMLSCRLSCVRPGQIPVESRITFENVLLGGNTSRSWNANTLLSSGGLCLPSANLRWKHGASLSVFKSRILRA
jgi:hypothetical protein